MKSTEQSHHIQRDDLAWLIDQPDYTLFDILTFYMQKGEFLFLSPPLSTST